MELGYSESLLQPMWPLRLSNTAGPYEGIKDTKESIQQNFVFLLQTIPGEWPMNPDLGIGVAQYLFETFGSQELDKLKVRAQKQLKKYLPSIKLIDAEFVATASDQDMGNVVLKITYSITAIGLIEQIDFNFDNTTKTFVYAR